MCRLAQIEPELAELKRQNLVVPKPFATYGRALGYQNEPDYGLSCELTRPVELASAVHGVIRRIERERLDLDAWNGSPLSHAITCDKADATTPMIQRKGMSSVPPLAAASAFCVAVRFAGAACGFAFTYRFTIADTFPVDFAV